MITENDTSDFLTYAASELEDAACLTAALAKEKQTNAESIIYVDADGNDAAMTVYGYSLHAWRSTDTFDCLAAELLGNPDYGPVLAYFNAVADESSLKAGTKIKIPLLSEAQNTENRIYASPEKHDGYGIDIAIDDDGDFDVQGGDFKPIYGRKNLSQALALRLTQASKKRIHLTVYGIRSAIGEPMALESYLTASIEQTIKADPRVSSVEAIKVTGEGDILRISVIYTDINGNEGTYEGDL
ncbi:MAG: hypothetical protein ACTTKL_06525 [Treponema sp.]